MSAYIKEQEEEAKSKAADMSRDIIANAINRYAQEEVTERTVTVVDLPSEVNEKGVLLDVKVVILKQSNKQQVQI